MLGIRLCRYSKSSTILTRSFASHGSGNTPSFHTKEQIELAANWPHELYYPTHYIKSAPVHPKTTPEMLALIASAHEEREPETFTSAFWIKLLFAGVTLTAIYRYNEYYMQDKEVHPFTTYISTWAAHFDSRKTIESNLVGIPERLQAANDQLIFNSRPTFVNPVKRLSFPDTFSRASDFLIPVGSQIDVSDVQFKHTWQENDELLGVPNPRE
ncbi:hypothetical protein BC833DRAFT_151902 [Globomyces pollinis-pini]|nr:hypothetical protein BC833DRAFT_151902 [Globomyces pollinis-pini]